MAEITMRERIARAIHNARWTQALAPEFGLDARDAEYAYSLADAVLAAMMEPTEEMIEVTEQQMVGVATVSRLGIEAVYRAMIEAAQRLPIDRVPILDEPPE